MNETRMIEVLARVEDERERFARGEEGAVGFDMSSWFARNGRDPGLNVCGTTACLAGHAVMASGQSCFGMGGAAIQYAGAAYLGLGTSPYVFFLDSLRQVYEYVAQKMGVDEQVLRDKVQGERAQSTEPAP